MTASSESPAERSAASHAQEPRQCLSALADGERESLSPGTALWRDDAAARERWHLYHLIGDVMRSGELATAPARDAAFVARLRARLADGPVPLAPAPTVAAQPMVRRLGWRAPAAVAAGFIAVAATLVLMRPLGSGAGEGVRLATGPASVAGSGVRVVSNPQPSAAAALVADGRMIRDARVDAYLRAHQAARGNSPAALPGGGLRNAEILVTPEPPGLADAATRNLRSASEPR